MHLLLLSVHFLHLEAVQADRSITFYLHNLLEQQVSSLHQVERQLTWCGRNLLDLKVRKVQLVLKALKVQLVHRVLKAHKALPRQFPVQLDHKA
jgi:hypothetical protein